jgi:hypothetical protein
LIDQLDKIRLLNDPTSEYMLATAWALGRSIDDEVISAADGTVVTGVNQDGTATSGRRTARDCNRRQRKRCQHERRDSPPHQARVSTPLKCRKKFRVTSPSLRASFTALLGQTEVTNQNYAAVKALVQGEIDTFMGFKFHRLERLLTQTDLETRIVHSRQLRFGC